MNSLSERTVENLPSGMGDNPTSIQALKVSEAAKNCVSQAVALCNSATSNGNRNQVIPQSQSGHDEASSDDEKSPGGAHATAFGNENVLTTAGSHAQIFNIVNTYHQQNPSLSVAEAPVPMPVEDEALPARSYPHVHYNDRVIWCVVENLTDHQRLQIKTLLRKEAKTGIGVPRQELENIKTNTDLIDCLEDHDLLSVHNTWFLQFLAFCARNRKIYKEVLEFMVERMTQDHPVCVYEPHDIKEGAHVQLKVAGDIERFTNMDIETFRQILAENCGNRVRYTNLTGINNGCVKLSFQVPGSCTSVLLKDAKNGAEWLKGNGIFEVSIDGEETVDLPKVKAKEPTPAQMRAQLLSNIFKDRLEDEKTSIDTRLAHPAYDPDCDAEVSKALSQTPGIKKTFAFVNSFLGGKPLLHWACELNKMDWVEFLIQHGADLNARDEMCLTALHKAAFLGLKEVCQALLRYGGIDVAAEDEDGLTPLQYAEEERHKEIVELLKDVKKSPKAAERKVQDQGKDVDQEMGESLIRSFIEDYLRENGVDMEVEVEEYPLSSKQRLTRVELEREYARNLRRIGDEFDSQLNINELIRQSSLDQLDNPEMFYDVAHKLFQEQGMSWGRVVVLMSFGGKIALHLARNKSKTMVSNVIKMTARSINDVCGQWMAENQGWEGFMKSQMSAGQQDTPDEDKQLSSVAAAFASIGAWWEQSY